MSTRTTSIENINSNDANNSLLSISNVSSIVHSMFEYLIPSQNIDTDDEYTDEENENVIGEHSKMIFVPIVEELCDRMSHLNFFKKTTTEIDIDIGIIDLQTENDEFIMNG